MGSSIKEKEDGELDRARLYRKIKCEGFDFLLPDGFGRTDPGESPFLTTGIKTQQTFCSPLRNVYINILSGTGTDAEKRDVIKELYLICMMQKKKLSFFEQGGLFRNPLADEGMTSYSFTDGDGERKTNFLALLYREKKRYLLMLQCHTDREEEWRKEFFHLINSLEEEQ